MNTDKGIEIASKKKDFACDVNCILNDHLLDPTNTRIPYFEYVVFGIGMKIENLSRAQHKNVDERSRVNWHIIRVVSLG